ncbi:hypothetical protein E2C01_009246 [Portunus trituberculatus]|uniref:Uncharacterized protein n=1 Tax=Portunus trituberculatus TaxID=210409 RepID=A0A5B7D2Z3_PORTR|nr:hypothetical protein [Portunus trituberculatus]
MTPSEGFESTVSLEAPTSSLAVWESSVAAADCAPLVTGAPSTPAASPVAEAACVAIRVETFLLPHVRNDALTLLFLVCNETTELLPLLLLICNHRLFPQQVWDKACDSQQVWDHRKSLQRLRGRPRDPAEGNKLAVSE